MELSASVQRLEDSAPERTKLVWASGDENVARISVAEGKCTLTPVNPGRVTITCRAEDNGDIKASVEIEIIIPVTEIKGIPGTVTLHSGGPEELAVWRFEPETVPENATAKTLLYSSGDESVVRVDADGTLHAEGPGTADITVTPDEQGANTRATCRVVVYPAVRAIGNVPDHLIIRKNRSQRLTPSAEPSKAEKRFRYESSDPDIVSISSDGYIKAKSCGIAILTVTAEDGSGVSAECEVRVYEEAVSITSAEKDIYLFEGQRIPWRIVFSPADTSDTKLRYETDSSIVAAVDETGTISARKAGKTTVRAFTTDGTGKAAQCTVHVEPETPVSLVDWGIEDAETERFSMYFYNACREKQVSNLWFELDWYDRNGNYQWGQYCLDADLAAPVEPGAYGTVGKTVYGLGEARQLSVRITRVKFSDGSIYDVP